MFRKSNRSLSLSRYASLIVISAATLVAEPFQIDLDEQFQGKIAPDKMRASISVGMKLDNQKKIKRYFDSLLRKAKTGQSACTGGSYSISPEYDYKERPAKLVGYRGNIYFQCTFDDTDQFDTSLKVIQKNIDPALQTLTQSGIQWISTQDELQKIKEKLKKEAIQYGMDYSSELTRFTGKACHISKIGLNRHSTPARPMREMVLSAKADATESPIKDEQTVTLSAQYTFLCE